MEKIRTKLIWVLLLAGCTLVTEQVEEKLDDGMFATYETIGGVKEGLYQAFYNNSQLQFRVNYENGKEEGKAEYFDSLGNLEAVEFYENGILKKITQYHKNGNISVNASKQSDYLNGPYFQMTEEGDTIVTALYESDTARYLKIYDSNDNAVLDYHLEYRLGFASVGADSLLIKIVHRSPDPSLNWRFAQGEFSDEEMNNYVYEKKFVDLKYESVNIGSFVTHKSSLDEGRIKGLIIEYDEKKDVTFSTPVDEKIE